jgi:antitoxin component of MazEF toxin-antitoxin module
MDFLYNESMARRKVTKESIRKVQQTHGSYHISIPMRIMRMLGWRERQKVVVKKYGTKKIVISDWVKKKGNNKKP